MFLLLAAGCGKSAGPRPPAFSGPRRIRLATTTSLDNSGLIDVLFAPLEQRYHLRVDVIAVGTGKALELGKNGDVDVVIVHDPEGEERFVKGGWGVNHRRFMHNDFLLVGPRGDPADIAKARTAAAALAAIASRRAAFVSRGDDSGTHRKERTLWRAAGLRPKGRWYLETGQGMGATLIMANEKRAYVLADRGTYLAFKDKIEIVPLCQGDPQLRNPYSIIVVDPARWKHVNYLDAMLLVSWITSRPGQRIIDRFRMGGERLFLPDAIAEVR